MLKVGKHCDKLATPASLRGSDSTLLEPTHSICQYNPAPTETDHQSHSTSRGHLPRQQQRKNPCSSNRSSRQNSSTQNHSTSNHVKCLI